MRLGSFPDLRNPTVTQGIRFGLVGGLLILVDWAVFVVLTHGGVDAVLANIAGRVVGAMSGFFLNGILTFSRNGSASLGWRRLLRFVAAWVGMTILSTAAIGLVDLYMGLNAAWIAKPIIDVALALLGFLVSRHWIYR